MDNDWDLYMLDLHTMLKTGFDALIANEDEEDDSPSPVISKTSDTDATPVQNDARIQEIINKFPKVFEKPNSLPPRRGAFDFEIVLEPGVRPTKRQYCRMSLAERREIWNEVQRLLKLGWIQLSNSDWASPILFAKNRKKDGKLRAVYDYRGVNVATLPHQGPIPRVADMVYDVSRGKWKSLLDISGAFNQLRVRAGDEKYTAFFTPFNLYESLVMPMGMRNAGPWMQAVMTAIFDGNPDALPRYPMDHSMYEEGEKNVAHYQTDTLDKLHDFVRVYIDDIVIFSDTKEEHYQHIEKVLERLNLFDIRVNEFSEFGHMSIQFLGFEVGYKTWKVLAKRAESIRDWPVPQTPGEVHTFLGLTNFYRDTVPQFALHSSQLTPLQKKASDWQWTEVHQHAFDAIKDAIARQVELYMPTPDDPFVLVVDASVYAIGGVLFQEDSEGKLRTVAFYSRQCRNAEPRYGQYQLEFLALVASLMHFRPYIDGCRKLVIYTDHKPLQTGRIFDVSQPHHQNHRIARWVEKIMHI